MKLQQLRYVCEIVDHGLNLSDASETMHRTQSGVSRYIKSLEDELGTQIFLRNGKRLVALTRAGEAIVEVARRMLADADTIQRIGDEFSAKDRGDLIVATTETHARHVLPPAVLAFLARFPKVRISLRIGNPGETALWIASGDADVAIAAAPLEPVPNLLLIPCYELQRIALAPKGHPILDEREITLNTLVQYPMIGFASFTGRVQIPAVFARHGLTPQVVLNTTDGDIMKEYVSRGLGIAIVGSIVYNPEKDVNIQSRSVAHLFPATTIYIGINPQIYLRSYAYDFIETFEPKLTRTAVERAISERKRANR